MLYSKLNFTTMKNHNSENKKNDDSDRDILQSPDSSADSFPDKKCFQRTKENIGSTTSIKETSIFCKHPVFHEIDTQEKEHSCHRIRHFSPEIITNRKNRASVQGSFDQFPQHSYFGGTIHFGGRAERKANVYNYVNVNIPFSSYLVNLANTLNRSKAQRQHLDEKTKKTENIADKSSDSTKISTTDIGDDKTRMLVIKTERCYTQSGPQTNPDGLSDISSYLQHCQLQNFQAVGNDHSIHPIFLQLPDIGPRNHRQEKQPAVKKYNCDICDKNFSRSNTLITHKRIHSGDKPFKCETCDRAFRQPGNLIRHRLTHTSIKPYVCATCDKAFNRASNLSTHMRTHSNIKAYTCPNCGKLLHHHTDFETHSCLQNDRCHKCEICGRGFGMRSILKAHRQIHH